MKDSSGCLSSKAKPWSAVNCRGLFSDKFLREDPAWQDNLSALIASVRELLRDAPTRWSGKDMNTLRKQLLEPLFKHLGFKPVINRRSKRDQTQPDYFLRMASRERERSETDHLTAAFVYAWDRWLDGPDVNDADTPEENPGACVVSALEEGADWIIVTNGRRWRLYCRQAHARAANFCEVDLLEVLTDSEEAFRYWWLFFRADAFTPLSPLGRGVGGEGRTCWLDILFQRSRDYARRLGERLRDRILITIFPQLAQGFLVDRKQRLQSSPLAPLGRGVGGEGDVATKDELADIFQATLTLLYRLLFLLHAESRELLPIRDASHHAASLTKITEEIAETAGVVESAAPQRLHEAYSDRTTNLYDRLHQIFRAMGNGDPILNIPIYNGGLFNTTPSPLSPLGRGVGGEGVSRDQHVARFLLEHKVPDRFLALAIDRLARDEDERTLALVFIDYQALEVRHLGSIYEGLLECKLKIAGEVYLASDRAERKASGSFYTPDAIIKHIVSNTVGPVLDEKLSALRGAFRKAGKTFDNELQKSKACPSREVQSGALDHRQWAALQTGNIHKDLVESFFDLRVLDPAMGSGHFLVETVDFITDRLLRFLNEFPINPVTFALDRIRTGIRQALDEPGACVDLAKLTDINLLRRQILKRCIYGVDLNPMAVELAKVSLWLDACTLDAPLPFLDHHLRCGNSLIGATFQELEEAPATRFALDDEPLLKAIDHIRFVSQMADATVAEAAASADRHDEARRLLAGYRMRLNLLMAEYFGEWKLLAEALAQRADRRFFHWEIEFPEVFFDFVDAGHRQIREGSAGFDCVVGNPPFIDKKQIVRRLPELDSFWRASGQFETARGIYDVYMLFLERARQLLREGGRFGLLTPIPWLSQRAGAALRGLLQRAGSVEIVNFAKDNPFADALVKVVAVHLTTGRPVESFCINEIHRTRQMSFDLVRDVFHGQFRLDVPEEYITVLQKIAAHSSPLRVFYTPTFGLRACSRKPGAFTKEHLLGRKEECRNPVPYLESCELEQGKIRWRERWLDYQPALLYSARSPELFQNPKLLVPSLLGKRIIRAVYDDEGFFADQSLVCIPCTYDLPKLSESSRRPSLANLLAQLNSMTISFYFAHAVVSEALGGGAIHATPGLVAELPVFADASLETTASEDVDDRIWRICRLSESERERVTDWYAQETGMRRR